MDAKCLITKLTSVIIDHLLAPPLLNVSLRKTRHIFMTQTQMAHFSVIKSLFRVLCLPIVFLQLIQIRLIM